MKCHLVNVLSNTWIVTHATSPFFISSTFSLALHTRTSHAPHTHLIHINSLSPSLLSLSHAHTFTLSLPSLTHPLFSSLPLSVSSSPSRLSHTQLPTSAPTGLAIDNATTTTLDLSWDELLNATFHANSSDIIGYRIYHQASGDRGCNLVSCAVPNQCQEEPTCIFGQCTYPSKPNNTACDDGNDDTKGDHCLDGECVGTPFNVHVEDNAPVLNYIHINDNTFGAGFFPSLNEIWYPNWSTVYRYARDGALIGSFTAGPANMVQIWGEPDSRYYYTAHWSHNYCMKRGEFPSTSHVWTYYPEPRFAVGGVSTDATYAYCLQNMHSTVHVLDKMTGQLDRKVELTGGSIGVLYGGFAVVGNKIYYGPRGTTVYRHNLDDGQFDGYSFSTRVDINKMAFTGQDYCISANSDNVFCYKVCLMRFGQGVILVVMCAFVPSSFGKRSLLCFASHFVYQFRLCRTTSGTTTRRQSCSTT